MKVKEFLLSQEDDLFDGFVSAPPTPAQAPISPPKPLGRRYNKGKVRWRNFPLWLCRPLADIGTYGELKYEESWNFLKGLSVTDCVDSLYRHLEDFDRPDLPDEDPESKINHLGHVAWNALVAIHMIKNHPDLDDRYKVLKRKADEGR